MREDGWGEGQRPRGGGPCRRRQREGYTTPAQRRRRRFARHQCRIFSLIHTRPIQRRVCDGRFLPGSAQLHPSPTYNHLLYPHDHLVILAPSPTTHSNFRTSTPHSPRANTHFQLHCRSGWIKSEKIRSLKAQLPSQIHQSKKKKSFGHKHFSEAPRP